LIEGCLGRLQLRLQRGSMQAVAKATLRLPGLFFASAHAAGLP